VSDGLIAKLLGLLVLVACSALFTGAEAAYFSLGRARLKRAAADGTEAEAMKPLIERPHELLVTLLVGVTLINIAAAALAALTPTSSSVTGTASSSRSSARSSSSRPSARSCR